MSTYYIDALIGEPENDGLSEQTPLDTHENLKLRNQTKKSGNA